MTRLFAALLVAGIAACATEGEDMAPTYGDGLGTAENPVPQDDVAYAVRTRIELGLDAASPQVAPALAAFTAFAQNPAHALITSADGADVAELTQLTSALSSTLASRLEGWINTEIDKARVGTKTVRQVATDVAGFAGTALTEFGLDGTLSFSPQHATHAVAGVTFRLAGFEVVVPVGGLKADAGGQSPSITVTEGGAITFGAQRIGLAFGDHAWQAINLASTAAFGATVRTMLGTAVGCRVLSETVAAKCVSGVCVGHASQINTVCERGLDLVVAELQTHVGAFQIPEVKLVSGGARLVDENGDGLANRIEDGVWDAQVGIATAQATFSAMAPGR